MAVKDDGKRLFSRPKRLKVSPNTEDMDFESYLTEYVGETLGSEYYTYFDCDYRGLVQTRENIVLRYGYYGGFFYYVKRGAGNDKDYLWKSREDGTGKKIIAEVEGFGRDISVYANSRGIFLCGSSEEGWKVVWYDFDGKRLRVIHQKNEVKSYYICDIRLFLVTQEKKDGTNKAFWLDMETLESHTIFTGYKNIYQKNRDGEKSFVYANVGTIMANSKRIVLYLEFSHFYYPEHDSDEEYYEKLFEYDGGGWYSYEFAEKKLKCINRSGELPHLAIKHPEKLKGFIPDRKLLHIAFFDMRKDVMWVVSSDSGNSEMWEARTIGKISEQMVISGMPVWNMSGDDTRWRLGKIYFDGHFFYHAENYYQFISRDRDGENSKNWNHTGHGACDNFTVAGGYLFLNKEAFDEEQYNMTFQESEPLRISWMSHSNSHFRQEENSEIERYEKEKKPAQEVSRIPNLHKPDHETKISEAVNRNDPVKLAYWKEFVRYAFDTAHNREFENAHFPQAQPADRNWYALRLGTSKGHIELSVNMREGTIRTALFVKNNKDLFKVLEAQKSLLESAFRDIEGEICWDKVSQAANVSIIRTSAGLSEAEQADWFMKCACILRQFAMPLFGLQDL